MYSSGYSQVTKNSPMAQKRMQYRSKGKSCGYYMRIVFFFSSLIQSLIIVSLVLFLVYGKTQDSASTARILDLEESFSRLSIENVALKQQRKNLTNLLNVTLTQKARNDWELKRFRHFINISSIVIQDYDKKLQQCTTNLFMCNASPRFPCDRPPVPDNCNCGLLVERLKARLELVSSNFTQTVQKVRIEMEQAAKERDYINLEAIHLRRDKSILERELKFQKEKYKDEFFRSLSGVSNVSKAFLEKIDSLFPTHLAFQLTCTKQREHLEQIRTNCTTLSREVENKLQNYLDVVGGQVSDIQAENSRLKAENWRLSEDYHWCNKNRTGQDREHKEKLGKLQQKHDQDKERLLMDKMKLNGEIQVLENSVKYKNKEVDHLTQQINYLNMSCKAGLNSRTVQSGWGLAGGGQLGRTGSGGLGSSLASTGLGLNKFGSTGLGSSSSSFSSPGSSSSLGSTGLGLNKFGSTGLGSSSSSFSSPGSNSNLGSTGLGLNKFGSTGLGSSSSSNSSPGSSSSLGSTGLGLNKFGSTGLGSSSSSNSSPGSSSSLGSTGLGLNKFGSTGLGSSSSSNSSPGSSSSLGSTGLGLNKVGSTGSGLNKQGSTGGALSSLGSASSNPGLSSSGLGLNKPTLNGRGSSTTGSSSSGSTGTKTGSTSSGFSWLGFGSSNSGQSKTGSGTASGTGRGTSSGSSNSGTGSAGSGRIGGLGGGSVNVAQHLQMLQLLINPPEPEEKEDRFRLYG